MSPTKLGAGTTPSHRPHWNGTSWASADIQHALLSAIHSDTETETPVAGDIIIANALAKWSRLAKGNDDEVLTLDSGLPTWKSAAGGIHGAELHTGDIIPSADQDFGGYRLKGLKRMASVPSAADIGTDGLVLTEIAAGNQTDTIGGTTSTASQLAERILAFPVTTTLSGTVKSIGMNWPTTAVSGNMRVALYSPGTGKPANLLTESASVAMNLAAGWQDVTVTDYSMTAGNFWLAYMTDTARNIYYVAGNRSYYVRAYGAFDATWGASSEDSSAIYNMRITYALPSGRHLYVNVNGTVIHFTPT